MSLYVRPKLRQCNDLTNVYSGYYFVKCVFYSPWLSGIGTDLAESTNWSIDLGLGQAKACKQTSPSQSNVH